MKIYVFKWFLIIFFLSLSMRSLAVEPAYNAVTFYVVAHQDDWQGLMNPNPYIDVTHPTNPKVIFIYTTAGNASYGVGPAKYPYYIAREEGAKRAVRFMVDTKLAKDSTPIKDVQTTVTINGHRITKYSYLNTRSYFLRLQDGSALYKLRDENSPQGAIDKSTRYLHWDDFVTTLQVIVQKELKGTNASIVWLNIPQSNSDENHNYEDHFDHIYTGLAMDIVASRMSCLNVARYYGYIIQTKEKNLSESEVINKAGVYGATVSGIGDSGHFGTWDNSHLVYMNRRYFDYVYGDGSTCF